MSETATGHQTPIDQTGQTGQAGQAGQAGTPPVTASAALGGDAPESAATTGKTPTETRAESRITAREVAAQHFARLLYAPVSTWSRYTFHETDPHPYGTGRRAQGRG